MAESARIEELRRRLDREPASRLFAQLAEELRKGGEQADAVRVARRGLIQHPGYTSARLTLARALLELGEFPAARMELEAVLRAAPDNILASRLLGDCLLAMGDLGSALLQLRATLRVSGGDRAIEAQVLALEERLHGVEAGVRSEVFAPPAEPKVGSSGERKGSASVDASGSGLPVESVAGAEADGVVTLTEPEHSQAVSGNGVATSWVSMGPVTGVLGGWTEGVQPESPSPEPLGQEEQGVQGGVSEGEGRQVEAGVERRGDAGPSVSSPTLAELYFQQGSPEKALDVYRELLGREPGNERARARFAQIEALMAGEASAKDPQERKRAVIARLEQWLEGARGVGRREGI